VIERLYAAAKNVVKTHTDPNAPRHVQITAMKNLQKILDELQGPKAK
jgi:hypothetical protein